MRILNKTKKGEIHVKKRFKILLAFVLSLALVVTHIPMMSAEEIFGTTDKNDIKQENIIQPTNEKSEAHIIGEVIEKREANTKVFRLSDGTYMYAEYPQQIHFKENNKWIDYDNTLIEEKSEETSNTELVNCKSDIIVKFSKKTNGKKIVQIEKSGYKISWYYTNAQKSTGTIEGGKVVSNNKFFLDKLTSTVLYKNIYKNIDLEYVVLPTALKENIILKSNTAQTVFEVEYKANGLIPQQIDKQTVILNTENGDTIYTISAPYMEDANGAYCENVSLELQSVKANKFSIIICLDEAWLKEENRAFPVLVDPVLKTSQDKNATQTAFVSSANPNKCYLASGTSEMGSLYVGNISGFGQTESYIKFTSLPATSIADKVIDARVYLALRKCEIGLNVNVKQLTTNWDPYTVKWSNKPESAPIIKDYMALTPSTDTTQFHSIEITDLVRGWYSGEYTNYGISLSTDKTTSSKAWFYSIHYTGYTAARPIMTVTFRNMSGYEDYWSYTSLSAGRSGTASVNNYNGNFIFTQPLTENSGNLMPVELSLVYNSNASVPPYTVFQNAIQTNYHIYVRYDSTTAANGYKYYLNDADGTRHWFYFENGSTSGKDEDGLGYTLYEITQGSDSSEPSACFKMCDIDGNTIFFDSYGNVIRIKNNAGISATVQYEVVNNTRRIKSITDGAGRVYSLDYAADTPKLCEGITDPAGRYTDFHYWKGLHMWIYFPDNTSVYMSRDESNWLINKIEGIEGANGNCINITYDTTAHHRVTEMKIGTNTSTLEKYSFEYKQNQTNIKDIKDRIFTYQFNDYGQTTGIVSNADGTAQFLEYVQGNAPGNAKANKLLSQSRAIKSTTNFLVNPGFTRSYTDGYSEYVEDWTGVQISNVQNKYNFTNNSVSISKGSPTSARANIIQTVNGLPAGIYTASCYINTDGVEITGEGDLMFVEVWSIEDETMCSRIEIEKTTKTNSWERRSVTFNIDENCQVKVVIGLGDGASGTVWFDDLQLEKGTSESSYNIIENSNALHGKTGWETEAIVGYGTNLPEFPNYFYKNGDITNQWLGIKQFIPANSKAGDVYVFGAWVKANSVPTNNGTRAAGTPHPAFALSLHYYNSDFSWKGEKRIEINPDVTDWQFVTGELILPQDSPRLCLQVLYFYNANNVAITGAFCYKEEYGQTYTYDNNGNVISAVDLANTNSSFAYYGNQMAQMLNPSGSKYLYNYNEQNQLSNVLTSSGQEYVFAYDDKGNLTNSTILARKPATVLESGKKYIIINAYSGLAIDSHWKGRVGDTTTTYRYIKDSTYTYQQWKLALTGNGQNIYSFQASSFSDRYLEVKGTSAATGTALQINSSNTTNAQKFKPVLQSDNTFVIYTAASNYTKVLDGQYDNPTQVVQSQAVKQADCDSSNIKASQRWYFYEVEEQNSDKIVTTTEYTPSGNFVSKTTDALGNATDYNYNEQTGTLTNVTDPNGNITSYTYDQNTNAVLSVSSGGTTVGYSYENDRLKNITAGGNIYEFLYDEHGRRTAVKIGTSLLSLTEYTDNLVSKLTYGNGNYINYGYDNLDRVTSIMYNGNANKSVKYLYGNTGLVSNIIDLFKNTRTKYTYDLADRLVGVREYDGTQLNGNTLLSSVKYNYEDKTNRLSAIVRYSLLGTQEISFVYGDLTAKQNPDAVYTVKHNGTPVLNYNYDPLGRLLTRTIAPINKTQSFTYKQGGHGANSTSALVETVTVDGETKRYTYDANGNIIMVQTNDALECQYQYNSKNELVLYEIQDGINTYSYDNNGNITSALLWDDTVKIFSYTDPNWPDKLTHYNGNQIYYDAIGNPQSYYDWKQMDWDNGRQLVEILEQENLYQYTYDGDGIRTSKTVNGTVTEFIYADGVLLGQTTEDDTLIFLYDESGNKFGFIYNGAYYYYDINPQGDVVGIYNSNGTKVVTYEYDPWGVITNITDTSGIDIGTINPIRYRGYYYDNETGFYYLQSRYYDPNICRFINADTTDILTATPMGLTDKNLFAYCDNNPVVRVDVSGEVWETVFDVVSLGASIVEVCINPTDVWAWAGVAGDAIDLIPFVTGVGEVTRAVKTSVKVVDKSTDVLGAAKTIYKTADATSNIRKSTGAYEILYKSGKNYIGKGGFNRAITSATRNALKNGDEVTSIMWRSAPNNITAFIYEYEMQKRFGGVLSSNKNLLTYNKIWSPGRRYLGD